MVKWYVNKYAMGFAGMNKMKVPSKYVEKRIDVYTDLLKYKKWRDKQERLMKTWNEYLRGFEYDNF